MKLSKILPQAVTRAVGTGKLKLSHNSPNILFAAGAIGVVAGTVLASRATLQAVPILDELHDDISSVKSELAKTEEYKKDLAYTYYRGALQLGKVYLPAVVVTGASIAALTGAHVTLTKRNNNLTLAYAGLHNAYTQYRERVREELGADKEKELYFGAKTETVKVDGKNVKRLVVDGNKLSPYARCYDETTREWVPDRETNVTYLRILQNSFNDQLAARGHLFLNEVYDQLGLERSAAGQIVGWVFDPDAQGVGDNYVDIGLFEAWNKDFMTTIEPAAWLDFNVDGPINEYLG